MKVDNGNIESLSDIFGNKLEGMSLLEQQEELELKNYIPIDPKDMTRKQKSESKVSLNDHRSKLGKQRLTALQERKKVFGR